MKTIYQKGDIVIHKLNQRQMIVVDRFKGRDGRLLCRFYHIPSGQWLVGEFLKEELSPLPSQQGVETTGFNAQICPGTPSSIEETKS